VKSARTILPLDEVQWRLCYHLEKNIFCHYINQDQAEKLPAAGTTLILAVSTIPSGIDKLSSRQAEVTHSTQKRYEKL
jgi:hypothetical protein